MYEDNLRQRRACPWISRFIPLFSIALLFSVVGCSDNAFNDTSTETPDQKLTGEEFFRGVMLGEGAVAQRVPEIKKVYAVDYSSMNAKTAGALSEFNDDLVETVRKKRPGFLKRFREVMTSGNPVEIRKGMQEANRILLNSLYDIPGVDKAAEKMKEDPERVKAMMEKAGSGGSDLTQEELEEVMHLFAAGNLPEMKGDFVAEGKCLAVGPVFLIGAAVHMYAAVTHSAAAAVQVYAALAYWEAVGGPGKEKESLLESGKNAEEVSLTEEQMISSLARTFDASS